MISVEITTCYIKLDSFLKTANLAGSGGEAKIKIAEGLISVNNQTELRRGRKLYPGDRVEYCSKMFEVIQGGDLINAHS